jgi:AGZA family xanthine/uracil permease-like MFS transporter
MLNRFFKLDANGTTISRELQAGLTTFAAMAYILAVNPAILADAGMDRGALVTVTALTAAVSTVLMALLTNYPIALAPGMGINAFFAYTICLGAGVPWQQALGMVFINGIVFLALSLTGIRQRIVAAIPYPMKLAITCGIGLFIAFIGLKNGGVVVASPATLVTHGNFTSGSAALCLAGIALTAILVARRVRAPLSSESPPSPWPGFSFRTEKGASSRSCRIVASRFLFLRSRCFSSLSSPFSQVCRPL